MTVRTPKMTHDDEALSLLAQMYAGWFMRASVGSVLLEVYERIRDLLYHATSQQDAYEQLAQMAETVPAPERDSQRIYQQARDTVAAVIAASGSADVLIVGQTDGYRHLCLTCCQDEHTFQHVPFFQQRERRQLLLPEVTGERRSASSRCQRCMQPIAPEKLVLFTFAGTDKHGRACCCSACNRAGVAFLLDVYHCDEHTQQVLLPALHQIAAPSRRRCIDQAMTTCWEHGWYMLNKDSIRP